MRLIGIAGPTASGKTTIARKLIEHYGADTKRFSMILADIAADINLPADKPNLQRLSTALRAHLGESVLARGMCAWAEKNRTEVIIVEGIRRVADVECLKASAESSGRAWSLIYVDAPFETRLERYKAREGATSREMFEALDAQEAEAELPLLKERADYVLQNADTGPDAQAAEAIDFIEKQ